MALKNINNGEYHLIEMNLETPSLDTIRVRVYESENDRNLVKNQDDKSKFVAYSVNLVRVNNLIELTMKSTWNPALNLIENLQTLLYNYLKSTADYEHFIDC